MISPIEKAVKIIAANAFEQSGYNKALEEMKMTGKIKDVWVTVKVELNGKRVSAIYGEWMDSLAVTLSARPLIESDEVDQDVRFSAADQAERFLNKIEFAPYQNIGEPEFEAAVEPGTANLRQATAEWLAIYTAAVEAGKMPNPVYCREFPEFDMIITTMSS